MLKAGRPSFGEAMGESFNEASNCGVQGVLLLKKGGENVSLRRWC